MEIVGQGHTTLTKIGKDRFNVDRVKPKLVIEFMRDSIGKTTQFKWIQTVPKYSFIRSGGRAKTIFLINPTV